jgi:hypothetical protein
LLVQVLLYFGANKIGRVWIEMREREHCGSLFSLLDVFVYFHLAPC